MTILLILNLFLLFLNYRAFVRLKGQVKWNRELETLRKLKKHMIEYPKVRDPKTMSCYNEWIDVHCMYHRYGYYDVKFEKCLEFILAFFDQHGAFIPAKLPKPDFGEIFPKAEGQIVLGAMDYEEYKEKLEESFGYVIGQLVNDRIK